MTDQLALDAPARTLTPSGKPLTDRQQRVWDLVRQTPGGITAEEAGALLHAGKGRHPADVYCTWCARDGMSVLRSKAVAPLVIRRRVSGRFEPREAAERAHEHGSQLTRLPTDLFGIEAA